MEGDALSSVRLIALDVDGVMTDGRLTYGPDGVHVSFSARDGAGIMSAIGAGLEIALVSFRDFPAVRRRASDLGIDLLALGCDDKAEAVRRLASHLGLAMGQVLFMGDDDRDIPAIEISGIGACPADAHSRVRERCDIVSSLPGGCGAVREVIDMVLEAGSRGGD
ncbi:HAD hydrolase family protein [Candidatus Fermentibacterales bacterium]|nr:HAD hydrolase family protein [Candidatus Fermentibacterales bacterium]